MLVESRRKWLLGVAVCAGLYVCCQGTNAEKGGAGIRTMRPYVVWSGAHSKIEERSYFRVTSSEEWTRLWKRHIGETSKWQYSEWFPMSGVPEVDFKQCMVVAVFQGKGWNSEGVEAVSITESANEIRFRFDDKGYQTVGPGPDGGGERVTAYGIFVVPRSSKRLVLEENLQGVKNRAPMWKERERFQKMSRTRRDS